MAILDHVEQLENLIASGRVPGTARCLINVEKFNATIAAIKGDLPDEMADAQSIIRQKESVIKQAELEARRIRAYADDEATTIRQTAEEKAIAATEAAEQQSRRMIEATEVHTAAQSRAQEIVAQAEANAREIVERAETEAQSNLGNIDAQVSHIREQAEADAENRKQGADDYAREVLFHLEERIAETLGQVRKGIDVLNANTATVG